MSVDYVDDLVVYVPVLYRVWVEFIRHYSGISRRLDLDFLSSSREKIAWRVYLILIIFELGIHLSDLATANARGVDFGPELVLILSPKLTHGNRYFGDRLLIMITI